MARVSDPVNTKMLAIRVDPVTKFKLAYIAKVHYKRTTTEFVRAVLAKAIEQHEKMHGKIEVPPEVQAEYEAGQQALLKIIKV